MREKLYLRCNKDMNQGADGALVHVLFCDNVLADCKEENFMDRLTGFDKVCAKTLI